MWEWHALGHIPLRDSYNPPPHTELPVGLRARQLDRPGHRRRRAAVGAQHLGALRRRHPQRRRSAGASAASTAASSSARARASTGSTTPLAAGRADLAVRQRLRPAEGEAVARACCSTPTLPSHTVTLVKQFTNPTQDAARLEPGRPAQPARRQLADGLRRAARTSPSTTPPATSCSTATLGPNVQNFRTFLAPWSGQPPTPPSVAAQPAGAGGVTVEASWNGATDVASWKVLAGASPSALGAVATAPRSGLSRRRSRRTRSAPYVAVAGARRLRATSRRPRRRSRKALSARRRRRQGGALSSRAVERARPRVRSGVCAGPRPLAAAAWRSRSSRRSRARGRRAGVHGSGACSSSRERALERARAAPPRAGCARRCCRARAARRGSL